MLVGFLAVVFLSLHHWLDDKNGSFVNYDRQEKARSFVASIVSHGASPLLANDSKANLDDFKGKPLLLHFWASWCSVCREDKAQIDALWDEYKDGDLRILAVASYDTEKALLDSKLMDDKRYMVVLDADGKVAGDYRVRALPETLYINAAGKVLWRYKGVLKPYDIRQIQKFVKDAQVPAPISEASTQVKI